MRYLLHNHILLHNNVYFQSYLVTWAPSYSILYVTWTWLHIYLYRLVEDEDWATVQTFTIQLTCHVRSLIHNCNQDIPHPNQHILEVSQSTPSPPQPTHSKCQSVNPFPTPTNTFLWSIIAPQRLLALWR